MSLCQLCMGVSSYTCTHDVFKFQRIYSFTSLWILEVNQIWSVSLLIKHYTCSIQFICLYFAFDTITFLYIFTSCMNLSIVASAHILLWFIISNSLDIWYVGLFFSFFTGLANIRRQVCQLDNPLLNIQQKASAFLTFTITFNYGNTPH